MSIFDTKSLFRNLTAEERTNLIERVRQHIAPLDLPYLDIEFLESPVVFEYDELHLYYTRPQAERQVRLGQRKGELPSPPYSSEYITVASLMIPAPINMDPDGAWNGDQMFHHMINALFTLMGITVQEPSPPPPPPVDPNSLVGEEWPDLSKELGIRAFRPMPGTYPQMGIPVRTNRGTFIALTGRKSISTFWYYVLVS